MRRLLAALLLLALLAPVAGAQEILNPIQGSYGDIYVIAGRVVDQDGLPVVRGSVTATLEAPNVQAEPLTIGTDCYGTFYGYYTLKSASPEGKLTVSFAGPSGKASLTKALDPFYRRSEFLIKYPGPLPRAVCPDDNSPDYASRVSVSGRILERVAPYESNGVTLDAKPVYSYARIALVLDDGRRFCPPSDKGADLCEPQPTDERGDFRYSWTFSEALNATGHVEVTVGNHTYNATVDPFFRMAWADTEVTGQGAPQAKPAPLPPALALVALVAVALGARRLLPRHPR